MSECSDSRRCPILACELAGIQRHGHIGNVSYQGADLVKLDEHGFDHDLPVDQ